MKRIYVLFMLLSVLAWSCKDDDESEDMARDPDTAEKVSVDRFSQQAGMLMVRDATNGLPEANAAVNFNQGPFITQGLGPNGEMVEYYNFDVQPTTPAPIYAFFHDGNPVSGQLNIIDKIPGETGYNDFWQVYKVTVPEGYVANTVTSRQEIVDKGFAMEVTDIIVNCPVVPDGSTATKRHGGGSNALMRGWYKDKVVHYFSFEEKALMAGSGMVPLSPIYVTFNENPPTGGPATGFVVESVTMKTHNVLATLPSNTAYSPLWSVNVYDNADFATVMNLTSAQAATILAMGVANVNCPVVSVQ